MKTVKTDLLEIAYFDDGPPDAAAVLLLHGWPDDALGMMPVADSSMSLAIARSSLTCAVSARRVSVITARSVTDEA